MSVRVLIPVRPPEEGKSRLATALDPVARAALNHRFFAHVLDVACATVGAANCYVVSRSDALLHRAQARGAQAVVETTIGHNQALARAAAIAGGDAALIALSVDLPFLTGDDLAALIAAEGEVIAAPDTAGRGTNALLLRRPGLIPFLFGEGSLAAHRAAADAAGLRFATVARRGLAEDIDTAGQLAMLGR